MLTTVSDRKIGVYSGGSLTLPNDTIVAAVSYYEPQMVNATDYYAFGMPSRVASSATGAGYRFGFNGKENDNEVKGFGNQQDYGMRIYDARVGRFLSVDPITSQYPQLTPYQFASNTPILARDLDGLEALFPWNSPGPLWRFYMWLKYGDPTGAKRILEGTEQQYNAREGRNSYHNEQVPETVQQKLDNINDKVGTGQVLSGSSQLIEWSISRSMDAVSVIIPLEEGLVITGRALKNLLSFSPKAQTIAVKTAERLLGDLKQSQLPRAVSAIVDRKSGKAYEGISGGIKSLDDVHPSLKELLPEQSLEKWPVTNCAECDALNKALKDGAQIENLEMHTVKIDKKTGKISDFDKCKNCEITTKEIKTTSQSKE